MKKLLLISLAALILAGCGANATAVPSSPTEEVLNITNPSKTIEVAPGSEFKIVIRSNPSTRYHWEEAEALDTKVVDYIWKDYIPDKPDTPDLGGRDIWRFKAVAPGQTTITLGYYYADTFDSAQMKTFTIVVK